MIEKKLKCPTDLGKITDLLNSNELRVINLGLGLFAETYERQGIKYIQVAWQPPAGGDDELSDMLSDLSDLA